MSLTPYEVAVLSGVEMGSCKKRDDLHHEHHRNAFDSLVERGLLRPVYVLSDRARELMEERESGRGKRHAK